MALRKTASSTTLQFALSLALAAAPAAHAGTIFDLWDLDHRQGLGSLDGWSLAVQDSTGSGTYYYNFNTGTRRQLAVSADGSEWQIEAGLNRKVVGSTGLYSLDLSYADVNVSIDGSVVTGLGGNRFRPIGALQGSDGEVITFAITDDAGGSLKLTRTGNGGYDGEASLLVCADAACTSVLENSSARLGFRATPTGTDEMGQTILISSLTAASVDAPEPTTYVMLGGGLILLGLAKRKSAVKA